MSRSILHSLLFAAAAVMTVASTSSQAQAQGWFNPEIYNSGRQVTGVRYDPFTGRIIYRTDLTKVRESALDPNRSQIDPGSYRTVNRYETDLNGVRWHVTGTQWTSNGVPHGNLSRRRVGGGGGPIEEDRNEHVIYDASSGQTSGQSGSQNNGNNLGPAKTGQFKPGQFLPSTPLHGANRGPGNTGRFRTAKPAVQNYSPF